MACRIPLDDTSELSAATASTIVSPMCDCSQNARSTSMVPARPRPKQKFGPSMMPVRA